MQNITLEQARQIIDVALAHSQKLNVKMNIAVVGLGR